MTDHTDLVTSYLSAIEKRELPGFEELLREHLTEDAICVEAARIPWGGTWTGISGYIGVFRALRRALEDAPGIDPDGVVTDLGYLNDDGNGTVFREFTLTLHAEDGTAYAIPAAETYRLEGGLISAIRVYFQDTAYLNEILSYTPPAAA